MLTTSSHDRTVKLHLVYQCGGLYCTVQGNLLHGDSWRCQVFGVVCGLEYLAYWSGHSIRKHRCLAWMTAAVKEWHHEHMNVCGCWTGTVLRYARGSHIQGIGTKCWPCSRLVTAIMDDVSLRPSRRLSSRHSPHDETTCCKPRGDSQNATLHIHNLPLWWDM